MSTADSATGRTARDERSSEQRAEQLMEQWTQRASRAASRAIGRAREEVEDIVAEAQSVRRGERPSAD